MIGVILRNLADQPHIRAGSVALPQVEKHFIFARQQEERFIKTNYMVRAWQIGAGGSGNRSIAAPDFAHFIMLCLKEEQVCRSCQHLGCERTVGGADVLFQEVGTGTATVANPEIRL